MLVDEVVRALRSLGGRRGVVEEVVVGVGGHSVGVCGGVPGRGRGASAVGYLGVEGE